MAKPRLRDRRRDRASLRTISLPVKVLYSCILATMGTGYLAAIVYLFLVDVRPHAKEEKSLAQVVMEKYHGRREGSTLEAALEGDMGEELTAPEKARVLDWLHAGASEQGYEALKPVFDAKCAACHNHDDMPNIPLTTFAEVSQYTKEDYGVTVKRLVRVSHIHLFGLTFIFAIVGAIFVQGEERRWVRSVLVFLPFLAIWADIGGWWVTKLDAEFAYSVILGGVLAGLSLAVQIVWSLVEMWLLRAEERRGGGSGIMGEEQV